MRVDVKKFLFVGSEQNRKDFFVQAQKVGLIHFINPNQEVKELPQEVQNTLAALKVLRSLPPVEQDETRHFELAESITHRILELHQKWLKLEESQRLTYLEIARVGPFGNFSHEDIRYIEQAGHRIIQFFVAKEGTAEREDLSPQLVFLNRANGLDYFMSINQEPVQYEGFSEQRIEKTVAELEQHSVKLKNDIHDVDNQLKDLAKYNDFLHASLNHQLNHYNLSTSENYASKPLGHHLFAVEGWVPNDKIQELMKLADQTDIYAEEIEIESNEIIPTYLENKGIGRIGEDLVNIYDTPSATDDDPSLWVLVFFATFFAMIVGDAGYGLIFLAVALYIRYKHSQLKGFGLRIWKLLLILSCTCIIWGILISSFFGISLNANNPIRKISLINWLVEKKAEYHFNRKDDVFDYYVKEYPSLEKADSYSDFLYIEKKEKPGDPVQHPIYFKFTDNILFEIALFVGVIHIIVSLLRYIRRNWSAIGWIIFMIGTYLYLPTYLHATSIVQFGLGIPKSFGSDNGMYMIVGGFALATLLALIQHRIKGLLEPMNVIQIFADTMSYLRIYALSLAGGMVAATINEFAAGTIFIIGALLFIIGHVTNIALSIMGGVIHGLRLNFIEWYHYSFEGGGKKFKPLRFIDKDKD